MRKISFDLNLAREVIVLCCVNVKRTLGCAFNMLCFIHFVCFICCHYLPVANWLRDILDSSTIPNRFIFNEFCVRTSLVDFSFPLAQYCMSCYVFWVVLKLNIHFNHLYYPFVCVMGDNLASLSLTWAFVYYFITLLIFFFSRNVCVVLCLLFLYFLFSKIEWCCDLIR